MKLKHKSEDTQEDKMRYLKVCYGDNDHTYVVRSALTRMWHNFSNNVQKRTGKVEPGMLPTFFGSAYDQGLLQQCVEAYIQAEMGHPLETESEMLESFRYGWWQGDQAIVDLTNGKVVIQ